MDSWLRLRRTIIGTLLVVYWVLIGSKGPINTRRTPDAGTMMARRRYDTAQKCEKIRFFLESEISYLKLFLAMMTLYGVLYPLIEVIE